MFADKDAVANTIFGVNESDIKFYQLSDWNWMEEDGSILSRTSTDGYSATMFLYSELGLSMRNSHVRINDIAEG